MKCERRARAEAATRTLPFHDQGKISGYLDVVDLVLDGGATPTVPQWAESLFGSLIRACVSRVPAERPSFTDIILKLREVSELDEQVYFFAFDLPRLREMSHSSNPALQSLAASELAELLSQPHIRRRSTRADRQLLSPTANASTDLSAGTLSPLTPAASTPGVTTPAGPAPHANVLSPPTPVPSTPSLSPPAPLLPPASTPSSASSSSLSAPAPSGGSTPTSLIHALRSPQVDGDLWLLSDEDAFDFLERFTALLSSSHRDVQLQSCLALRSLLQLSCGDQLKRALDRELVISAGGLGALLALLLSEQASLARSAGEVLLLLSEELSSSEEGALRGLDPTGLERLRDLMLADVAADEAEAALRAARTERKRKLAAVVAECADAHRSGASSHHLRRPKGAPRRSMTPMKFHSNPLCPGSIGAGVSASSASAASRLDLADEEQSEDSDREHEVSAQLRQAAAKAKTLQGALTPAALAAAAVQYAADIVSPGALPSTRDRGSTAMPMQSIRLPISPATAGDRSEPSVTPAGPSDEADASQLSELLSRLQELLARPLDIPSQFADWYGEDLIRHCSYVLLFDADKGAWSLCLGLLLPQELRLFADERSEPDEPLLLLRTRLTDPDTGAEVPCTLRLGARHGLENCFVLEDCGRLYTFCAGSSEKQMQWRELITGKSADQPDVAAAGEQPAGAANPLPAFSVSVNSFAPAAGGDNHMVINSGANNASSLFGARKSTLVAAGGAAPPGAAAADPSAGVEFPRLDAPTPPFLKRFRDEIIAHSYLLIRDAPGSLSAHTNATRGSVLSPPVSSPRLSASSRWTLRYVLLVGRTLRIYDSHRASPNEPWSEHEIEPVAEEAVNSSGDVQDKQFSIRLFASTVQFDCCAASVEDKTKWVHALSAGLAPLSPTSLLASTSDAHPLLSRLAPFCAYFSRIDFCGWLLRKRKRTNRWLRQFVVLVDSECHYYESLADPVDKPAGTLYIATPSGKAFSVKQSSKRAHCLAITNPLRTYYLAAEVKTRCAQNVDRADCCGIWVSCVLLLTASLPFSHPCSLSLLFRPSATICAG